MAAGKKSIKSGCPICRKDIQWEGNPFRPFCSARCRLIDLGKWASEEYRIPEEKKKDSSDNGADEKNGFRR